MNAPVPDLGPRFRDPQLIGRGTTGLVVRVWDADLGALVALKVLNTHRGTQTTTLKREFRILSEIQHDGVVRHYDLVQLPGGQVGFTMELVAGEPFVPAIRRLLAEDPTGAINTIRHLVAAIQAIHQRGVVHRDLKPANVLVRPDGRVVVLDFGLAILARELALEGRVAGTLAYLSPEALTGSTSPATDWFALGAMMAEAGSDALPWRASDIAGRTEAASLVAPRLRPDLPELYREVTLGFLLPNRERWDGARAASVLGGTSPAQSSFVGRQVEIGQLRVLSDQSRHGGLRWVVAHGAPGVGKSRLLREFADSLPSEPAAWVGLGRCRPGEQLPLHAIDPILDEIERALRRRGIDHVEPWYSLHQRWLAQAQDGPQGAGPAARRQAISLAQDALHALTKVGPVVLAVDDAQWADLDSALLLAEILAHQPGVLLIVAGRPEVESTDFATTLRMTLPPPELLALNPLEARSARQLVQAEAPDLDPDSLEEILRESRNIPFLLEGFARAARAGETRLDLANVVRRRQANLDPGLLRAVYALALDPQPLSRDVLLAVARRQIGQYAGLRELQDAHWTRTLHQDGRWILYHDLLREPVLLSLEGAERTTLHEDLAEALQRHDPRAWGSRVFHLQRLGRTTEASTLARFAASDAMERGRWAEAGTWLDRAAAWSDRATPAELEQAASAWARAGRPRECAAAWARVANALRTDDAQYSNALQEWAHNLVMSGQVDEGEATFRKLLALYREPWPPSGTAGLIRGMVTRALVGLFGARPPRPDSEADPGLEAIARASGALSTSRFHLSYALSGRYLWRVMRSGTARQQARALSFEVPMVAGQGAAGHRRATRLLGRLRDLARRYELPPSFHPDQTIASAAWAEGRWGEAIEAAERSLALFRKACPEEVWRIFSMECYLISGLCFTGQFDRLGDLAERAGEAARDRGDPSGAALAEGGDSGQRYFVRNDLVGAKRTLDAQIATLPVNSGIHLYAAASHGARFDLATEQFAEGLVRLRDHRRELERLFVTALDVPALILTDLEVRLCLANARTGGEPDRSLNGLIRSLHRRAVPWGRALALRAEGGALHLAGDLRTARGKYLEAADLFAAHGMTLDAWAARRAAEHDADPPCRIRDPAAVIRSLHPASPG